MLHINQRMTKSDVEKAIFNANRNSLIKKYRQKLIRRETLKSIVENQVKLLDKALGRSYQSYRIDLPIRLQEPTLKNLDEKLSNELRVSYFGEDAQREGDPVKYMKKIKPYIYNIINREIEKKDL